jgi:hypothetical protein
MFNLAAIETALRDVQRAFPQINKELIDQRDPLDDDLLNNLIAGYAMVDRLLSDTVDIFAMGHLHYWRELNAVVLCGPDLSAGDTYRRLVQATETRFYNQPDGGIREIIDWYALRLPLRHGRDGVGQLFEALGIAPTRQGYARIENLRRQVERPPSGKRNEILFFVACRFAEMVAEGEVKADRIINLLRHECWANGTQHQPWTKPISAKSRSGRGWQSF